MRCTGWLAGSLYAGMAAATPVWQWTDTGGQQHYSDTAPRAGGGRLLRNTERTSGTGSPTGLRRGEIENLRRIERRLQRQQDRATRQRREDARAVTAERERCRVTRSRWHDTRDYEQRRTLGDYLRRHCW